MGLGGCQSDAGQKIGLEGGAGDTYLSYDSSSRKMWMYVNGQQACLPRKTYAGRQVAWLQE